MLEDSINPNRREALRAAFADLERCGEKPLEHNIRTARPGEEITGQILGHDDRVASIVTDERIIAVDFADLPERLPDDNTEVSFTARSDFSRLGREQQATEAHMRPEQAEQATAGQKRRDEGYRGEWPRGETVSATTTNAVDSSGSRQQAASHQLSSTWSMADAFRRRLRPLGDLTDKLR